MKIGIVGTGAIALANAAWLAQRGHGVRMWSPRVQHLPSSGDTQLTAVGVVEAQEPVTLDANPARLARYAEVLLIAVPVNGHRGVMDALTPHLHPGQTVIVSSMASLSALYLHEAAAARGCDITVASFGTTVFTARREGPMQVRVLARRKELGVSALPRGRTEGVVALCRELFGEGFRSQDNALATSLSNINPIAHGPLALFNWTRIERAENWPQYHHMTPRVAAVILQLEAERLALAKVFGLQVRAIEQHFSQSFGTQAMDLAAIAAELHAKRGGPPGPIDIGTRFLTEDVPFGLVFLVALGNLAAIPMPATSTIVASASLIVGRDFAAENDLVDRLKLHRESPAGLLARVNMPN